MEKNTGVQRGLASKADDGARSDIVAAGFDEQYQDEQAEEDKDIHEYIADALKHSKQCLKNYCDAEVKDAAKVDFSILLDGDEDTYRLRIKVDNPDEAMDKISSLLRYGYSRNFIGLRDNMTGKTIFEIFLFGDISWYVGINGTREEIDEWSKRNRDVFRPAK